MVKEIELIPKQLDAFRLWQDSATEVLVYGGAAGGGKTWLSCTCALVDCLAYPGIRYFVAREELKRIYESWLVTFFKLCKSLRLQHTYKYSYEKDKITFKNGSEIIMMECKNKPGDDLFQRFGSIEFTRGIIEEAGEVHYDAYEGLMSRTGRHLNDMLKGKIMITCNPQQNWLYEMFWKPFTKGTLAEGHAFIQSFVTDNHLIPARYVANLEKMKNETQKKRLRYGIWEYAGSYDQLIEFSWIDACFSVSC